jgi:hypothetical protein
VDLRVDDDAACGLRFGRLRRLRHCETCSGGEGGGDDIAT